MNWFHRMKVSTQLITGFLIVAAIGAAIGAAGILQAAQMNDLADTMYQREMVGLRRTAEANLQMLAAARSIRTAFVASSAQERGHYLQNTDKQFAASKKALLDSERFFVNPAGKALMAQAQASLLAFENSAKDVARLMDAEPLSAGSAASTQLTTVMRPLGEKTEQLMAQLMERKNANADALNAETDRVYHRIQKLLIGLTVGGVLGGIAIGLLMARNLKRQLGGEPSHAADIAAHIAQGDLTVAIGVAPNDQTSLMAAMQTMRDSLVDIVGNVRQGTDSIATATSQIAAGNQDLSSRTEQQASSLQETAASMEELTSTVKQNADSARQANQLAVSASQVAVRGGSVVAQVVDTMDAINGSSRKIVEIIAVIDSIAFQTNILALNAAVEAARAGEQGRGFAVVASEVRTLAQRSASAAKEIKGLIDDSVGKVEQGSVQVSEAGKTMEEIVSSVRRVTDIMGEISAASQEQTVGIEQVNQAVSQMDQVTQQNAALVEEAAAAADSLQGQARHLSQVVSVFRLAEAGSGAAARAAPLPATPSLRKPALAPLRQAATPGLVAARPRPEHTTIASAAPAKEDSPW